MEDLFRHDWEITETEEEDMEGNDVKEDDMIWNEKTSDEEVKEIARECGITVLD